MKRGYFIGIVLFLLCIGSLYLIKAESKPDSAYFLYELTPEDTPKILEGDLILRRGYGFVSTLIMKMMDEDYPVTHLGVITKRGRDWFVVHSLSSSVSEADGIQLQRLDSFVNDSYPQSVIISRIKAIDKQQRTEIKQRLSYYLKRKIPFDHYFDSKDTTAFYCSELVWKIYEKDLNYLKVDTLLSDKEKYNNLKTFYDPKYFDIIVNHHQ